MKDCRKPDDDFASRAEYMNHELACHDHSPCDGVINGKLVTSDAQESTACLFCGEETGSGKNDRGRHVGRHMEEIAFAVVSKPYEEWDFYSDSSANNSVPLMAAVPQLDSKATAFPDALLRHQCEHINPSTSRPCNSTFSQLFDLTMHEDIVHNHRVRCPYCAEEKIFSRNDALIRHIRVVHPELDYEGKDRICIICGESEERFTRLEIEIHMRISHPEIEPGSHQTGIWPAFRGGFATDEIYFNST